MKTFRLLAKSQFNQNALVKVGEAMIYEGPNETHVLIFNKGKSEEKIYFMREEKPKCTPCR